MKLVGRPYTRRDYSSTPIDLNATKKPSANISQVVAEGFWEVREFLLLHHWRLRRSAHALAATLLVSEE